MKLFVVILHFGDVAVTRSCVENIETIDKFPKTFVIVNNTPEDIEKEFKKKVIINNRKNLGFARGVNKGISYAIKQNATHILLVNNDTSIKKPLIGNLVTAITGSIGIVAPALQFKKNNKSLFDVGGNINRSFWRTSHREVEKITDYSVKKVAYVSGCCMLIKKEVFQKIGLFDEHFFLYYEDADFCLRAQKARFDVAIVPSVSLHHLLSSSKGKVSPFTFYHLLKSDIYFGKKYAKNTLSMVANRLFILFQAALFIKANPRATVAVMKALLT